MVTMKRTAALAVSSALALVLSACMGEQPAAEAGRPAGTDSTAAESMGPASAQPASTEMAGKTGMSAEADLPMDATDMEITRSPDGETAEIRRRDTEATVPAH